MCGIAGYIGESNDRNATWSIISKVFEKLEVRGVDAAGFWMSEKGESGKILHHKQPGRSSDLVGSKAWNDVAAFDCDLSIVHARGASKGYGSPLVNQNNHPFISESGNIALAHNGKIDDDEYKFLKEKYGVKSECDSEILLRVFEHASRRYSLNDLDGYVGDLPYPHRMAGVKDIFSLINHGHMAVSIGEYDVGGKRCLWLFRNRFRPMWVFDLRSSLGQIFFVSEPSIWREAASEVGPYRKIMNSAKMTKLPDEELWFFHIDNDSRFVKSPIKMMVSKSSPKKWVFDGFKVEPQGDDIEVDLVTTLNEADMEDGYPTDDSLASEMVLSEIEKQTKSICDICNSICANSQVLLGNNTISATEAEQVLSLLEEQKSSMAEIENILN